jgi:hypothetical protein
MYVLFNQGMVLNLLMSGYCLRKSLALFKSGRADILICTDVAARGIDVAGIPYVVGVRCNVT